MQENIKKDKLSARKAKTIAYRYINSWITEACREDSQFYDITSEESVSQFGYDAFNHQHITAISSAFKKMEKRFSREFHSWKPKITDYSPDFIKLVEKLKAEGKLKYS